MCAKTKQKTHCTACLKVKTEQAGQILFLIFMGDRTKFVINCVAVVSLAIAYYSTALYSLFSLVLDGTRPHDAHSFTIPLNGLEIGRERNSAGDGILHLQVCMSFELTC